MKFADLYLSKNIKSILLTSVSTDFNPGIIVVIPAYNEPEITRSLYSLYQCAHPVCKTEVIVLVNWPEDISNEIKKQNLSIYNNLKEWCTYHSNPNLLFSVMLYPDMPSKYAGVGLARKTLMDEAVRKFNSVSAENGIIVSFDADSVCDTDFLQEIESHFYKYPEIDGCTIYFEHPTEGKDFPHVVYKAIILYELHLRYYVEAVRYTGYPNSFHTIGSCFAVRAGAYCRQGGMNRRKAGEDFYFLQKFFEIGSFNELNSTRVMPSPRPSYRVPFGTGAIIRQFEEGSKNIMLTYDLPGFEILKCFFGKVPYLYNMNNIDANRMINNDSPGILNHFLESSDFTSSLEEIKKHSGSLSAFEKRFFRWFNLFRILKFLNQAKNTYPDKEVVYSALELIRKADYGYSGKDSAEALLWYYRRKQRGF